MANPITFYAGDSRTLTVTVLDASNNPVNLTGAYIKWALLQGTTIILTKDTNSGITITNATAGQFSVALSASDTKYLADSYQHTARLTDSSGNTSIIFSGDITVSKSYI